MVRKIRSRYLFVIVFFIVFCCCDILIGFIGRYCRRNLPQGQYDMSKLNYVLTECDSDVVIIGPSSAYHHYNPLLLKSCLDSIFTQDYTIYNAGLDAFLFRNQCCLVESLLNRSHIKILIWDLHDVYFYTCDENLSKLRPYYNDDKIVTKYLNDSDISERIKLCFNSYRYNSTLVHYVKSYLSEDDTFNGYVPLYDTMTYRQAMSYLSNNKELSNNKNEKIINYSNIELFRNIILLCREKNVNLIVLGSPRYGTIKRNEIVSEICKQMDVLFLDYKKTSYFTSHPELFKDQGHLNNSGVMVYDKMICDSLKVIYTTDM